MLFRSNDNVHEDFYAVSQYLAGKKVISPQILKTCWGDLFVKEDNQTYRAQSYINGCSFDVVKDTHMAFEAGLVIANFHKALIDFNYQYKNIRKTACDYAYHQESLRKSFIACPHHDFYKKAHNLAKELYAEMSIILPKIQIINRHVHGDPKISNILFDSHNKGICLVDFDTLSNIGFSAELADAIRSLSNPYKEDDAKSYCDLYIVEALLKGYSAIMKDTISPLEIAQISINALAITLCLSMRYLCDVLMENYFSYDNTRFSRAAEHNLLRSEAMYKLFLDMKQKSADLSDICTNAFK